MSMPCCYDCRFWSPGEEGSGYEESLNLPNQWESEAMSGLCRYGPPVLGETIRDRQGEETRWFGQWPMTMACDWCGRFERRPCRRLHEGENPR